MQLALDASEYTGSKNTMSTLPSSSLLATKNDSLAVLDALLKLTSSESKCSDSSSRSHPPPQICTSQNESLNSFQRAFPGFLPPFSPATTTSLLATSGLSMHPNLLGTAAMAAGMILPSTPSNQQQLFSSSQLAAAVSLLSSPTSSSISEYVRGRQHQTAPVLSNTHINNTTSTPDASGDGLSLGNVVSSTSKVSGVPPIMSSPAAATTAHALKETDNRNDDADSVVRPEKVVAALKSKPQRGKRREDLSEKERMELTRTRNREHAKSTRLRKKARYQELLDSEEQLKLFQRAETLRQERIATIIKFVVVRDEMLNDATPATSPSGNIELQDLVDHLSTFQFEIHGHKSISLDTRTEQHQDPQAIMLQFDRDIRERCRPSSTDEFPSFHYNLVDGANDIAISKQGSGFARLELLVQQRRDSESVLKLLSGILTVQFVSTSSLLSSVSWFITESHPSFSAPSSSRHDESQVGAVAASSSQSNGDDSSLSTSSNETLENQMIHPSVVSLDLKASHTETTDANGIGMSI